MFYFIIFCVLAIFSLLEVTDISAYTKILLQVTACAAIFIIAGTRYETGGDWTAYQDAFNQLEPLDKVLSGKDPVFRDSYMEFGYKLLNSIVKTCGGGIQSVFLLVSLINIVIFYDSLKTYLKYPIVGILVYFTAVYFALDFIATRQSTAVMIFFFAIRFIYRRQFFYYLLAIIAASLFHRSVLILFPLYFFLHKEFSNRFYIIFFISSLCIFFLQIRWMTWLLVFAAQKIGGNNAGIIANYALSSTFAVSRSISIGTLINLLLFGIYIHRRSYLISLPYFTCFFNLFMLNIVTYFVFYEYIEISDRYRFYFLMSNVVLLPYLLFTFKKSVNKVSIWAAIVFFCFLYGRSVFLEEPGSIAFNPYQNYIIHLLFNTKSTGKERLKQSDILFNKSRSGK